MIFSDSIVALSSGRLPAGVAVIRISGPRARFVAETISGPVSACRVAEYRKFLDRDGAVLDRGLVIFFAAPNSFTGEDVAEFHVHGGRAVVAAMLRTLTSFDAVRNAEPGEFTRRAFLNGKIDLVETEALADLLTAETEAQRCFAVQNAGGAQSNLYLDWRKRLIHARAMVEAGIDFSDEEDVTDSIAQIASADIRKLVDAIDGHLSGYHAAEIIRDGFDVVILGAPNAGKSSLFNALARRDAAIVTDEPGTTRDLLEVALDIDGLKVRITDTAGLRREAGTVETIGIERALARARQADLVLLLEDMLHPMPLEADLTGLPMLRIGTKCDLVERATSAAEHHDLEISVRTDADLRPLLARIRVRAAAQIDAAGEILPSRMRHVELLKAAREHLMQALTADSEELQAEELRLAADQLGRIVGAVDTEELLDVIFGQFCIGK